MLSYRFSITIGVLLSAAVIGTVAGLAKGILPSDNPQPNPGPGAGGNPDVVYTPEDAAPTVDASNAFTLALYRELAKGSHGENVFLSPYSVSVALAMAGEGARGDTLAEMRQVLQWGATDNQMIHRGHAALAQRLAAARGSVDPALRDRVHAMRKELDNTNAKANKANERGDWRSAKEWGKKAETTAEAINTLASQIDCFELNVANAVWVDRSYPLASMYQKAMSKFYGTGSASGLDFRGQVETARSKINTWVSDRTGGRIRDLIPKGGVSRETRLVLTNAVFFKGEWAQPFEASATHEVDFFSRGDVGKPVKTAMMHDAYRASARYAAFNADGSPFTTPDRVPAGSREPADAYPAHGFQMLELPYKGPSGETLSMVLVTSRDVNGLEMLESQLTAEHVPAWLAHLDRRAVNIAVPRFKMQTEQELSETLKSMGMRLAFTDPGTGPTPMGADFSGITDSTDPNDRLFISKVFHKTFVEVNEKGTEAAAATAAVMVAATSAAPSVQMVPFVPQFRADRPFVVMIRDAKSGVILFIGRVTTP